ncbi:alpha/beta hydrolase-fold protein [Gordonia sp. LSe1-13]|uniref:Alpha/beta hydrolase-fold protein n=1 Tax=Gordonia sesuvii TaxID=3116777 RepID=A0ABU7MG31_9ACTN|nr:alpha/beta hydrolase-fold protein [Gordonia sp. LSe1-13]
MTLATAVGFAAATAGQAFAVDPTTVRSGCAYVNESERAQNIQTCWVWSESMQTSVTVKVRPSDKQAGESEQAVYFLGSLSDPSTNGRGDLYSTEYNLVAIPDSANTWSSNWQSTPVDTDGNPLTTYEGGEFTPQWETFVGEELPAFLNESFDISTSGNAVSGLSISGGQAINLALKYPDVFSVAVSRSGYYQTDNLLGYLAVPFILATRHGISNGFDAMWGNPFQAGNTWADNDVASRLDEAKANGQTIIISTGNGLVASQDEWDEMIAQGGIAHVAIGVVLEVASFASAVLLNAQAAIFDLPVEFIYTDGAHTWNRWIRTDEEEADRLEDALGKYEQAPSVTDSTVSDSNDPVTLSATNVSESTSAVAEPSVTPTTTTQAPPESAAEATTPVPDPSPITATAPTDEPTDATETPSAPETSAPTSVDDEAVATTDTATVDDADSVSGDEQGTTADTSESPDPAASSDDE